MQLFKPFINCKWARNLYSFEEDFDFKFWHFDISAQHDSLLRILMVYQWKDILDGGSVTFSIDSDYAVFPFFLFYSQWAECNSSSVSVHHPESCA